MPKLNVQQNNANVIKALRNALAIGQIKGPIASDGNDNFISTGSNRNLLDNAYFVGGGSQLGDGVFPINQRGQTVYTSDGTGIDRWKQYAATVTLASDGVTVTPSAYSNNFLQMMNPAKWNALVGKTVTLSIEVLAVTGTITVAGYNTGIGTITSTGIAAFTFTMPSGIADGNKFFGIAGQSGSSIKFSRWKLEEGTVSTLANDPPPDFGEELRKCQRYLWVHTFAAYDVIGNGYTASATVGGFSIYLPVSMRTGGNPQATYTTLPSAYGGGNASNLSAMNIASLTGNIARYYVEFSGMQANNAICVMATANTTLTISAEL